MFSKFLSVTSSLLLLVFLVGLTACADKPAEIETKIAKAVKKFDTEEQNIAHEAEMRKYHMDHLKHKRDQTMYSGIRTAEDSLIGCIHCHVPAPTADKVVRHTDPEHFCATCHAYVGVEIDCFQCHADHPDKAEVAAATNPLSDKNSQLIASDSTNTSKSSTEAIAQ